jgi:hypothetical protein
MEEDLEGNYRGLARYCVGIVVEALRKTGVIPQDCRFRPRSELGTTRVEVCSTTTTADFVLYVYAIAVKDPRMINPDLQVYTTTDVR